MFASPALLSVSAVAGAEDFTEEADSVAAVALVSAEVAVLAAWLRLAVAARLSDRVRRAVSALQRPPDREACGPACGTVRAEQTPAVVGALLRGAAMALQRRLPGFDPTLVEACGNRSAQFVRLLPEVPRQGARWRQMRWKRGTPSPRSAPFQQSIAPSGIQPSAIFASE